MLHIKTVSTETYKNEINKYNVNNFLQSAAMAQMQTERQNFDKTQCILIYDNNHVVGHAVINYRKRYYFFKEALIIQGPLFDYNNITLVKKCFRLIEKFLKQQGASQIIIHPYIIQQIMDENLNILEDHRYDDLVTFFGQHGYDHHVSKEDTLHSVGQIFVKPLQHFKNVDAMYEQLPPSLRRDLKKFQASQVKVRELTVDELPLFNDILQATSARKGFSVPPLNYFELLKKYFKDDAKFMLAYLDCPAYQKYLSDNIKDFTDKINKLEAMPITKKIKGQITDAKDQLSSYIKRQKTFEEMNVTTDELPLSAYIMMCYGNEIVSILGGSYDEYLNFGGATMINWEMIKYAYQNNYQQFNFYGTIETNEASKSTGNFHYKRQFGGQLQVLIGTFTKSVSLPYKIIMKLKA